MTKECIFSKFTNKSSDCVAELLLWPQGLPFSLLSLIFLTWPFGPGMESCLLIWLLTPLSISFLHSHCTNSAFHVLSHHFSFVILPLKIIWPRCHSICIAITPSVFRAVILHSSYALNSNVECFKNT